MKKIPRIPHPPPLPSLTDLPNDVLFEIMRRVGRRSFEAFVCAKATCSLLRDIGDTPSVRRRLAVDQVPPFVDEIFEPVEDVINI